MGQVLPGVIFGSYTLKKNLSVKLVSISVLVKEEYKPVTPLDVITLS